MNMRSIINMKVKMKWNKNKYMPYHMPEESVYNWAYAHFNAVKEYLDDEYAKCYKRAF